MLSARRDEVMSQHAACASGDAGAEAYFRNLFAPTEACFLCDRPAGTPRSCAILADPNAPSTTVLLAPVCNACNALPPEERARLELRMVRAMWPGRKWTPKKTDPAYLRGSRVKRRPGAAVPA